MVDSSIIDILKTKLQQGKPFVNCGPVLITLNPYGLSDFYDGKVSSYYHVERDSLPEDVLSARSHIFSISRAVRQFIVLHEGLQAVLFMGFSGSGKSYAADVLIRQSIRPYPVLRTKPVPLSEPVPLYERVLRSLALVRRAISAGSSHNSVSTRSILEVDLKFQRPSASSENRAGTLVGASFHVFGLERWRVCLRKPTSPRDSPFFLLNELIAALVCTGFSSKVADVIQNAWRSEERDFLSSLAKAMLTNEKPASIREWGVSFEATVLTLTSLGLASVQIAHLFRALSAAMLLSNIDFNTGGGLYPLNLSAENMRTGASWKSSCLYSQWPEEMGAEVKCNLDTERGDADSIIEAAVTRRAKAKQVQKKAGRGKPDTSLGLPLLPEKGIFSNAMAFLLPLSAGIGGMQEDMIRIASLQGGFKDIPTGTDLHGKLLDRLAFMSDRSWISSNGSNVNAVIIDFAADLLEVETMDLYAAVTQPSGKEKTANCGTVQSRCDAIASALYGGVVTSITDAINRHFENDERNCNTMMVFDTPGFEDAGTSHFSALYRNLTAEFFNSYYVSKSFTKFEKHCREESLPWKTEYKKISTQVLDSVFGRAHLKADSVKEVIESINLSSASACRFEYSKELLAGLNDLKKHEIFSVEEDKAAWDVWNAVTKSKEKLIKKDKKMFKDAEVYCRRYCLQHYSGRVSYSAETWVETNRCTLNTSLIELLGASSSSFVRRVGESALNKTLLGEFQDCERTILTKLGGSQNHFVQCIRPNNDEKSGFFDEDVVVAQARAMQLSALGDAYSLGYHMHYCVAEFITKYKDLITGSIHPNASEADYCREILRSAGVTEAHNVGKGVLLAHRAMGRLVESLMKAYRRMASQASAAPSSASAPARQGGPTAPPRGGGGGGGGAPPIVPRPTQAAADTEDMYLDVNDINPRNAPAEKTPAAAAPPSPTRSWQGAESSNSIFEDEDMYLDVSQIEKPVDQHRSGNLERVNSQVEANVDNQDMYLDLSEVNSPMPNQTTRSSAAAKRAPEEESEDTYLDLVSMNSSSASRGSSPAPPAAAAEEDDVYLDLQDVPAASSANASKPKPEVGHRVSLGSQDKPSAAATAAVMQSQSRRSVDISKIPKAAQPRLPPMPALPPGVAGATAEHRMSWQGRSMDDPHVPAKPLYPSPGSDSGQIPMKEPKHEIWFHGVMERNEAVRRLETYGGDCFLVRGSTTREGSYTLSFVHQGQINHFKISVLKNGCVRMPGNKEYFESLSQLVAYHQTKPISKDGKLLHVPCPR